jgi:GT2 family glycosyltransferase
MSTLMVIPTLGERPDLLRRSISSIRNQRVDVDLVLVAPTGTTIEKLAGEVGARFVADPGTGGLAGALNAGLRAGATETSYFGWLGDDDLLEPDSLSAAVDCLDRHPEAVMVFGWCDYIDLQDRVVFRSRAGRIAAHIVAWGPNLVPQPGSLMRYDDVMAVGGLDESLRLALDLDLFLRLRRRGSLMALPQTLAAFRWHPGSMTVQAESASMNESDRVRQRYMSPVAARTYEYLRWPGQWALRAAKRRVAHNLARASSLPPRE